MSNLRWAPIIETAAAWVASQRFTVSLRQVFYRLVSTQLIPNSQSAYKRLSELTAVARRAGTFPALSDGTREVTMADAFRDLSDYVSTAVDGFALDRTRGQDWTVVIGVEKRGMAAAAWEQFGDRGYPVVAMGGYTSETITRELAGILRTGRRPSVLLYAGDFDASGLDIYRYVCEHVPFTVTERVALTLDQVAQYALPVNPGKDTDSRAAGFAREYGQNVQVEVDALDPEVLAALFDDAAAPYWDRSTFEAVVAEELAIRDDIRARLAG